MISTAEKLSRLETKIEKRKENAPVSDAETLGQTSFFESKRNPYED